VQNENFILADGTGYTPLEIYLSSSVKYYEKRLLVEVYLHFSRNQLLVPLFMVIT